MLEKSGYADAAAEPREVVVDHADHTMQPTFKIAAGPVVRLGVIRLSQKGRTNPRWVAALAGWKVGEVYRPEAVAALERRLLDTGVYDQVTVALAPANETARPTPNSLRRPYTSASLPPTSSSPASVSR